MKSVIILIAIICFNFCQGQVNMYSVKSGNWNDSTVWNTLAIPNSTDNVTISSGDTVCFNSPVFSNDLVINTGAVLNAASGSSLTVKGSWTNHGNFIFNQSTVLFTGLSNQSINGTSSSVFYNMEVSNINGVTINSSPKIKKLLNVVQGVVNISAGKKITLLSDSNGTGAIAPLLNGADVQGDVAIQRYISSNVTGWRFLGAPVRTTLQDWADNFLTSGFPGSAYPAFYFCSIYGYDETVSGTSVNGYVMPASVSDSILPGNGYWCWIGPTPSVVEVTGIPGKFNHTFSVSLTPSAGKNEDGWNMIANPYPCAIDWDSPAWTKTGIQDAVYIWDPVLDQYSTYMNGIGINGGSNIILSSQAFWVEANQNNPVLTCNENVKTTADNSYQKTSPSSAIKLIVQGNGYKDESVICFSSNGDVSVKASEDAVKLFSDNPLVPSITSVADTIKLAINTLPVPSQEYTVPVCLKVGVSGTYTISNNTFTFPLNCCVFLEDRLTGNFTDMKTASSYSFFIADTTSAPRFLLHVSKPLIKAVNPPTCSYKKNGKAVISTTLPGKCTYTWKDAFGNPLTVHFSGEGKDSLSNLNPGYYYVDVTSKNDFCGVVTEEIIVDAVMPLAVAASVVDNACKDTETGAINILNVAGGTSPYYFKWSDNKTIPSRQNLKPGNYTLLLIDSKECFDTSFYSVKTKSNLQAAFKIVSDTANLYVNQPVFFKNESSGSSSDIWNFGGITSNSINPQHTFGSAGIHTVVLTVKDNHCTSSMERLILVKEIKPVEEEEDEQVQILSFEDKAMIKFNLDAAAESSIRVFNLEGKVIYSQKRPAHTNTEIIALGESHGMYLVQVEVYGLNVRSKMIK